MKKLKVKVTGMKCASCETLIKDSLEEMEGIEKAEVFSGKSLAIVTYDEAKTGIFAIKATIRKEGFGAE